jgi:anti-sigma regulatory factor (Ser/Thr protein kinase)
MSDQTAGAERVWCAVFPHHAEGARRARHRLAASLAGLIPAMTLADAVAIAAELAGNSVRHAAPLPGGVIRVAWRLLSDALEIRVTDGGAPTTPTVCQVGPDSPGGRGLAIVAALADGWGVDSDGPGQCVWARMKTAITHPVGAGLAGAPA